MKPKSTLPPADASLGGPRPVPVRKPVKVLALLVSGVLAALLFSGCIVDADGTYYPDTYYYPYSYYDYGWPYYGTYGPYYHGRGYGFRGVRHGEHFGGHHFAGGSFGSRAAPGAWHGAAGGHSFGGARAAGGSAPHIGGGNFGRRH